LSRAHVVLLTAKWIYLKLATSSPGELVPCFPLPNQTKPDLFVPEATVINKKYKKDQSFKTRRDAKPTSNGELRWRKLCRMARLYRGHSR